MKLSILIVSLVERKALLDKLVEKLNSQAQILNVENFIEILVETDNREQRIGKKRNTLLQRAQGEYFCFVDDDDDITDCYLQKIFEKIMPDCCSLKGLVDGSVFEHSLRYTQWKENNTGEIRYERTPNHLNVIRRELVKDVPFPEIDHGEDHIWSQQIADKGLLKNEAYIPEVLYYYIPGK